MCTKSLKTYLVRTQVLNDKQGEYNTQMNKMTIILPRKLLEPNSQRSHSYLDSLISLATTLIHEAFHALEHHQNSRVFMDAFRNLSDLKIIHYEILNISQALVSVDLKDSYPYDSSDNGFKGHSIAEICEMKGQYSEDYYHQMELKYTT